MLAKYLGFDEKRMSLKTEFMAGTTTFLTMCYILAVNPDILSAASMDKGAVFTATALSSAIATLIIAFLAKLPFAQAPGMGINAFFAFTLVQGMGFSWETALTCVFLEGIIFIIITTFNIRDKIINCVPLPLRFAISAGVGMFIAFIGLKNAGIIVDNPATYVSLASFNASNLLACLGIILSGVFLIRKIKGALFFSIMLITLIGIPLGITNLPNDFSPISMPQSLAPTFFKFDFSQLLNFEVIVIIFALVFMDLFNTLGTLIGAAAGTELMDDNGNVKNIKQAMMADAIGTSVGAILGTSTVTTYVESGSGIAEGGRSGITALTTAGYFILALFLSPIFLLVPSVATAGALVIVGVFMMDSVGRINWSQLEEAIPSFITIITMVLSYSIANGIALGMLSYIFIKVLSGKAKEVTLAMYFVGLLFILQYFLV